MLCFHSQSLAVTVAGQRLQDPGVTSLLQPGSLEILSPLRTSRVYPEGHGQDDFPNSRHLHGKPSASLVQRDARGAFLAT